MIPRVEPDYSRLEVLFADTRVMNVSSEVVNSFWESYSNHFLDVRKSQPFISYKLTHTHIRSQAFLLELEKLTLISFCAFMTNTRTLGHTCTHTLSDTHARTSTPQRTHVNARFVVILFWVQAV